jgi:hypothetical protein
MPLFLRKPVPKIRVFWQLWMSAVKNLVAGMLISTGTTISQKIIQFWGGRVVNCVDFTWNYSVTINWTLSMMDINVYIRVLFYCKKIFLPNTALSKYFYVTFGNAYAYCKMLRSFTAWIRSKPSRKFSSAVHSLYRPSRTVVSIAHPLYILWSSFCTEGEVTVCKVLTVPCYQSYE